MTHIPKYYAKVSPYVDPVMEKTRHFSQVTYTAVYKHSKPLRDFISTHLPPILEKVNYEYFQFFDFFVTLPQGTPDNIFDLSIQFFTFIHLFFFRLRTFCNVNMTSFQRFS